MIYIVHVVIPYTTNLKDLDESSKLMESMSPKI